MCPTEVSGDCDILLRDACVVTIDPQRRIFCPGAVAIKGKEILAVGPDREVAASCTNPRG